MQLKELQNGAFSGAFWKFSERIIAQFVSFIVSVILARMLVPDDYSVVGIVTIFFTFSNVLISGGFNAALIQKKNADQLDYSSVLVLTLTVTAVIYIVLFICSPLIAEIYNKPILISAIRVMGAVLFVNSFKSVLTAYISSNLQFKKFFFATIVGTLLSAVIGIIMARKGYGAWALIAQQMSNSTIDTILLAIAIKYKPSLKISFDRIRSLFAYGSKIYLASIITVVYDEIKPLIVGIKFSTVDLAYYNKGESFPKILNSSITDTMASVLFPVISKVQDDIQMVRHVTRRYMRVASYVVFPIMIGLLAVSKSFIVVLLTEKWLLAVPYVQIFCTTYMFNIIQTGNLQAIRAIGRSDIVLKLEVVKKVSYLIVIVLFIVFSKSPIVLALSGIITTAIACIVNAYPNSKYINYGYRQQIKDIMPNLAMSVLMGVLVYALNWLTLTPIFLLVLQIIIGIVIYIMLSIIFHNENYRYLTTVLKQTITRASYKQGKRNNVKNYN